MNKNSEVFKLANKVCEKTGVPEKKIIDFLFFLKNGEPIENNELVRKLGVSKNVLNQIKEFFIAYLKAPSKNTELSTLGMKTFENCFHKNYQTEETLWKFLEDDMYLKNLELLQRYQDKRPKANREFDQFIATSETTARRASLLNFFEDLKDKRILFLGDDDFTSVAAANYKESSDITVLDIDDRMLGGINFFSEKEDLKIVTSHYDARKKLPSRFVKKFDVVFTDPPYTKEGVGLFTSRAIESLDLSNKSARIYICYGNSDRAKERFLPIYEEFNLSGFMTRWVFDKFNRYNGAESIGSSSTLFILNTTSKTKPLINGNYGKPIYTNN